MKSSGLLFAAFLAAFALVARSAHAVPLAPGDIVITAQLGASDFGLLLIDPTTGDRTIISDNTHGTGTDLSHPIGLSLDSSGNLLVMDQGVNNALAAIFRIDPLTGNRSVVSSNGGVGTGPAFSLAIGAIEVGSGIVVSNEGSLNGVNPPGFFQSVDPATGNRVTISGAGIGTGPALVQPVGFRISGDTAIVADYGQGVLSIGLSTGNRTLISGSGVGSGPALTQAGDIEIEKAGTLLVDSQSLPGVFRIDPITGDRTILSSNSVGTGQTFDAPTGMALQSTGTILLDNSNLNALLQIDPLTGNRTILSDATHGTGPAFTVPIGVMVVPNVTCPL